MPRKIGSSLPTELAVLIDGRDLPGRVGETFLLLTAGEDGWPHVAMLSAGEVLAPHPSEVRLALWPASRTTGNVQRSGRALLMAVVPPATYYVRLDCRPLGEIRAGERSLAAFACDVAEVEEDVVSYARVLEGIRFELAQQELTVAGWSQVIAALTEA